jgi:DNA-binding XRE family transcriptional regulator
LQVVKPSVTQEAKLQIDPTKLIEARLGRAMSQEEVAIACDLSTRTIQRIEAGHTASLESTKALLTTFGASIIHDPEATAPRKLQLPWRMMALQIRRNVRLSTGFCFDGLRIVFAAVFMLIAAAKPFVPDQTGMFVGRNFLGIGLLNSPPAGSNEVLGLWITPLMIVAAGATLLTVRRLRLMIDN